MGGRDVVRDLASKYVLFSCEGTAEEVIIRNSTKAAVLQCRASAWSRTQSISRHTRDCVKRSR